MGLRIGDNQFSAFDYRSANSAEIGSAAAGGGEIYPGGRLEVELFFEDTQRDFVWRGLYRHAVAAGLPHEEAAKFAQQWAGDKLLHHENGATRPFAAREFAELKKKGAASFDLDERYSANVLEDLRERQTAFRLSQQNDVQPAPNVAVMSAPQLNANEQAVKWLTDAVDAATGSDAEIGKQFNRLSVSGLRLMGQLQDLRNRATETVSDAVRAVAPDAVDRVLDNVDRTNRQTAEALKNASSTVTKNDRIDDLMAAKAGIKRPVAEDLHRKLMYAPEAIPNAIDSAVKGDFKEDDGSYSDQVGKIVGGLNPLGDVRDITANGKKVIEGNGKSTIPLIASVIGSIPGGGDVAKPIIKEVGEEIAEKAAKEAGAETAEKIIKEEGGKIAEFEFKEVEIVDKQGNSIGEFDKIEKDLFVEEKSAKGLFTPHPKTGKPIQTPEQWARKQIYEKSVTRIENLRNAAVSTRTTLNGSQIIPSLDEIKDIRKLEFRIDGDTPELRNAVEKTIKDLSQKYPNWKFSATFGK